VAARSQRRDAADWHRELPTRTIDGVLAYLGKYHDVIGKEYETFVEGVRSLLVTLDAQIAKRNTEKVAHGPH
jgi:hypothetical protein